MPGKSPSFNNQQKKSNIRLVENALLFSIPLLIGIGDYDIFIIFATCLMFLRIILLVKYHKVFTKWELFKELFNRFSWFFFNGIYFTYWILEKIDFNAVEETKRFQIL